MSTRLSRSSATPSAALSLSNSRLYVAQRIRGGLSGYSSSAGSLPSLRRSLRARRLALSNLVSRGRRQAHNSTTVLLRRQFAACIHVDGNNLILEPKRSLPTAFGAVGSRDLVRGWLASDQGPASSRSKSTLSVLRIGHTCASTIREGPVWVSVARTYLKIV